MPDLRRISVAACVLLVVLRISIGWQFFYEGLWKYRTLRTATPWSAEGYLKNARGPLRNTFRNLTGDPNDLQWLDVDAVAARWDDWKTRFTQHYRLNEAQQKRLDVLLNGRPEYAVELEQLPEGVEFTGGLGKALRYDPEAKRLIVPGDWHLTPAERDRALALAPMEPAAAGEGDAAAMLADPEVVRKYRDAVSRLYDLQSRLSYKERLKGILAGDPAVAEPEIGEIAMYRKSLARYEDRLAKAEVQFESDHLHKQWGELQEKRASLVGPVKQLDAEIKRDARELLSVEQLRFGPPAMPWQSIDWINALTMGALAILGFLLIAGLLSRVAAAGGALLLLSFYLAMPPWPWVPGFHLLPGPDHSYIVDKNLIEVFALAAIACLPTGSWFGLDALFFGWWTKRRASRTAADRVATNPGGGARTTSGNVRGSASVPAARGT